MGVADVTYSTMSKRSTMRCVLPVVTNLRRRSVLLGIGAVGAFLAVDVAQPLARWAMVSAAGRPVVVFGSLHVPRIAPFDADLFFALRQAHSVLAHALVAVIAAHVSAVLLHTLTLRDGMLSRMAFARRERSPHPRARVFVHDTPHKFVQMRTLAADDMHAAGCGNNNAQDTGRHGRPRRH
jgi:hypothetical protein